MNNIYWHDNELGAWFFNSINGNEIRLGVYFINESDWEAEFSASDISDSKTFDNYDDAIGWCERRYHAYMDGIVSQRETNRFALLSFSPSSNEGVVAMFRRAGLSGDEFLSGCEAINRDTGVEIHDIQRYAVIVDTVCNDKIAAMDKEAARYPWSSATRENDLFPYSYTAVGENYDLEVAKQDEGWLATASVGGDVAFEKEAWTAGEGVLACENFAMSTLPETTWNRLKG